MNIADHVGPSQAEHVVVSLQLPRQLPKQLTTKVVFRQSISLNHRARCTVKDKYALLNNLVKSFHLYTFIARSISLRSSFSFSVCRLSNAFLPLQRAMSILARPLSSMNTSVGTIV